MLQKVYMDADQKGFGILVTRTANPNEPTYTFFVQREVDGRTVRVKIGRLGDLSAEEARRRAQMIVGDMLKGVNPNREKKLRRARGITLGEATAIYREKPAKRTKRPKSKHTVRSHENSERHLADWAHRPLAEITRSDVLARHKKLSAEIGPVTANNVLRWFRGVYNAAMMIHESLPPNPCIVLGDYWNFEERKRRPIKWESLREWAFWADTQLRQRNGARADLEMFYLFSGLRSEDARTIRLREIDLAHGRIFRPKPKGGEHRAYDMPLSTVLVKIVGSRGEDNQNAFASNSLWLFPALTKHGRRPTHVQTAHEKGRPSPHRLRDTYATAAHEAKVARLDQKILMNHKLPQSGDVTEGYQRPSWEHLCAEQERIAAYLMGKIGCQLAGPDAKTIFHWS